MRNSLGNGSLFLLAVLGWTLLHVSISPQVLVPLLAPFHHSGIGGAMDPHCSNTLGIATSPASTLSPGHSMALFSVEMF
jgi:hypothetical protein